MGILDRLFGRDDELQIPAAEHIKPEEVAVSEIPEVETTEELADITEVAEPQVEVREAAHFDPALEAEVEKVLETPIEEAPEVEVIEVSHEEPAPVAQEYIEIDVVDEAVAEENPVGEEEIESVAEPAAEAEPVPKKERKSSKRSRSRSRKSSKSSSATNKDAGTKAATEAPAPVAVEKKSTSKNEQTSSGSHMREVATMLYQTTPEHEELRAAVREFAEREIAPIAAQLDRDNEFPTEAVKGYAKNGWMGLPYAKEYGGAGKDVLSYAIAVEELSRVDGGAGVILSAHTSLGSYPIEAFGTEAQKKKYLVDLASGKKIGAFGLTEPDAGSDAGGTETTAVDKGDYYLLNGEKIFITNAPKADTYVVFASTAPELGTRGISAFIVEKGWEGFDFGDHYDKMGIRSSSTAQLIFNNVKVPKENLLGEEGMGFKIAMATLDGGRIGIAAQALGIAQGAFEKAVEYAKEREQFGAPIGVNQGVSFKIADMATKIRNARFLVYSAAELKQAHEDYGMQAAMAKMYASDIALEVTNDALQIYGGAGFLKGDMERYYRDAKITTIYEGTNEIQRVVIAGKILGRLGNKSAASGKPAVIGGVKLPATGVRKLRMFTEGDTKQKVNDLVAALKADGYDFSVGIPADTPIAQAERVVSGGKGIESKDKWHLIEDLAQAAGAAIGSSRPAAETLQYVPMNRYVGMSGQKFTGNLYIACGISGAKQHLKGIKDASTIVAINKNGNAPIFKNCDYGIVGDVEEVLPLLTKALGTGKKKEAGPMVKIKRPRPPKPTPIGPRMVCNGCAYEYYPEIGDTEADIAPGTQFADLPEDWVCPECAEPKANFIDMTIRGL